MPTETLRDPLDGAELKAIILSRISDALDKDCTLTNDIAYAGFHLNFVINLTYKRSKVPSTLVWGNLSVGDTSTGDDSQELIQELSTDTYESDSPNTAREEHGLPVPVLVKTPTGMERRKVIVNPRSTPNVK